jgi:phosphoglycolate phosphatase-like HAD superfamily hydrolase
MADTNDSPLRRRPVVTVLDVLRKRIDHRDFDAVALSLDALVVDLGYGDVRALLGSVSWIEKLRDEGKKIAVVSASDRAPTALDLAGVDELVDVVVSGAHASERMTELIDELDLDPARVVMVSTDADELRVASDAGIGVDIGLARGASSPEQLRKAGADAVVADLQELLRVP